MNGARRVWKLAANVPAAISAQPASVVRRAPSALFSLEPIGMPTFTPTSASGSTFTASGVRAAACASPSK